MSITRSNPNCVFLGGQRTVINTLAAKAAITPGHLVERVNTAGVWRLQKHATANGVSRMIATEHAMANKGPDDDYAIADLVEASEAAPGSAWWMFIASGQNIAFGDRLESAGNGTLRILGSGVALFVAEETQANVTVQTRIRVSAL